MATCLSRRPRLRELPKLVHCNVSNKTFFSSQHQAAKKPKKYTSSIILPFTKFPLRHDSTKRAEVDTFLHKESAFASLYAWQRVHSTGPDFILHDGPPYANGSPHMGHAINKILKDVTIRHKLMQGFKVHYMPGWDCHGLPIEMKALGPVRGLSSIEIRKKAREFAKEAIAKQRETFRSWGIMADWDEKCYFTFDQEYVKNQLHQFYRLFEKNLVYRDVKPVFWSPSSNTALAEAELEYNPAHRSTAISVRICLSTVPSSLLSDSDKVFALVWTTTPWTLPANQAICFSPELSYSLVQIDNSNERYIIATNLVETLLSKFTKKVHTVSTFPGSCLSEARYRHPLIPDKILPFLPAGHVTADKGTGLVHTAPAHGPDDFLVALQHNIDVKCTVDEAGCYTSQTISSLHGLSVLGNGATAVLDLLKDDILHTEDYIHSYPYDWRTKQPIILRASRQWFIDTAAIKRRAIEVLKDVKMYPERGASSTGLVTQLERRPYWCISRQRVWGVPIPVLYHKVTQKPIVTSAAIQHYCNMIDQHGTDFWWTLPIDQLVTEEFLAEHQVIVDELEKGQDILDIWFDSGISWSSVLGDDTVADLYLEGVDQFTGWFQSSLMTSVALRDVAPYKAVFVHGFAVDDKGRKMSKSEGNVVNPEEITRGGKDKKKSPAFGVDTLRWWVACHATQHSTVTVSRPVIQASADAVQKIRIVLRFLLGVLDDAPHTSASPRLLDQYLLHLLFHFNRHVTDAYDTYQFNRVCTLVTNFVTNDVSALYCHVVKDRLYCEVRDDAGRRAAQMVARNILEFVLRAIAPILPHLAEEVYLYHPCKEGETLFRSGVSKPRDEWDQPDVCRVLETALDVKRTLNKSASVTNTLELDATVFAGGNTLQTLQLLHGDDKNIRSELIELLQVSSILLVDNGGTIDVRVETTHSQRCLCDRCRRYTADVANEPCRRCLQVLNDTV